MTRYERILNGAANWGAFFRKNPDVFVRMYLHITLRFFQKMLLVAMFWASTFVFIAARGIGKSFLSAIYCVTRCILYPGTKVCVASGTRGQAISVLEKINLELVPKSPELKSEIKDVRINGTEAIIIFKNTSYIKVVTANDNARSNRANVLLLDEFRLIDKNTINGILKKFLTDRRQPEYRQLSDAERQVEYNKEKNITMYLSSAYWQDHWSYTKCLDTLKAMVNPNLRQFVCGFPYQLSIAEGLLDPDVVSDEMSETGFNEVIHSMEMCALFYGSETGSFFDFESISKNRRIKLPMLPAAKCEVLSTAQQLRVQPKVAGEIRILSADIALMSSRKHDNDATAIVVNQMLPTKAGRYTSNIVYVDTYEGMHTDDQALVIRKLYDEFKCDYIVIDANGVGLGVFDALIRDIVDRDSGEIYPALSCCNNQDMAARCTVKGAERVIWAIKASAQMNSDCAFAVREGFRSGRIRLLETEYDAEEQLRALKGYNSLGVSEKVQLQMPYIQTTLLIDEITKLQYEEIGGRIRVSERPGMRKDRYSSLAYNYYVAQQIEKDHEKRGSGMLNRSIFIVRAPAGNGRSVDTNGTKYRKNGWTGW